MSYLHFVIIAFCLLCISLYLHFVGFAFCLVSILSVFDVLLHLHFVTDLGLGIRNWDRILGVGMVALRLEIRYWVC